jgi:hypothetical protein
MADELNAAMAHDVRRIQRMTKPPLRAAINAAALVPALGGAINFHV